VSREAPGGSGDGLGDAGRLRQRLDGLERTGDLVLRELEILELPVQERVVGVQVEVAVAGEVEEDRALAPLLGGGLPQPTSRTRPRA
jgi:hypothetical protein